MGEELVRYEVADGVALLTWNRAERNNAWSVPLGDAYFAALDRADRDPAVRVIVVTGAGKSFCVGADMELLQAYSPAEDRPLQHTHAVRHPLTVRKPLVAAINGACAGLGFVQALYCDVRFAAAGAKLTTAFARRGLIAEHGSAWLLPRVVGLSRALDLLLSGRVVVAEEAQAMGLVDRVVPAEALLAETLAYAGEIARHCSPAAMATIKRQVHAAAGDFDAAYADATTLMLEALRAPDFREGVASYLERREPEFPPLA